MKRASVLKIGTLPSYRMGLETYDPDKLGLGPMMVQQNGIGDASFAGPMPISVVRPMEASTPNAFAFPAAFRWSNKPTSQWDWIFAADANSAGATRRVAMFRLDRLTGNVTYDGFITITFPGTSEAKTIRAFRVDYMRESTGTISVVNASQTVTGVGTLFNTNRVCVGNRIGFGSTDPDLITQWYEISIVNSDTTITLTTFVTGTIPAGTPYVIEDLRMVLIVTSATTNLGGVYLVKGLRREFFSSTGGSVPAGTTIDSIRACYFLRDAATGTALASFGAAIEDVSSVTSRNLWVLETLANPVMFKFNIRALLFPTAGVSQTTFLFKTGAGGVLAGVPSQNNNGRFANVNHGPGNGLSCIYFTTTTRIYRTADIGTITNGSVAWLIDNMTEVPPGGINTYAASTFMQSIEYCDTIDKFVVNTSGANGIRSYITQYRTDGGQMDRIILSDFKQQDQGTADSSTTPFPSQLGFPFTVWVESGMAYMARTTNLLANNQIYCVPLGADWEYAANTGCRIIFPRIACPNANTFNQAFVQAVTLIGGASGKNLGMPPQPFRIYYRTAGIPTNSGGWSLLPSNGDMSAVAGASFIQFMAEFRMDNTLIPARLLNLGIVYDDNSMSDYWQGSSNIGTSLSTKQFGFRHSLAYGSVVPRLVVQLFDAETGSSLGTDDSVTQAWTWSKSVNAGVAWVAYNTTDRTNATTYIRVAPPSLADNITVRAVIREY